MAHLKTRRSHKDYFRHRNVKETEKGRPWLVYFPYIMKDMGCGTFKEVKELALDRVDWKPLLGLCTRWWKKNNNIVYLTFWCLSCLSKEKFRLKPPKLHIFNENVHYEIFSLKMCNLGGFSWNFSLYKLINDNLIHFQSRY